jgi:ArsR family transcriptional regulator
LIIVDASILINTSTSVNMKSASTSTTAASFAGCCAPLTAAVLSEDDAVQLAEVLKVLADPVRLRILSLAATAGEVCACDLIEPIGRSQPTISHHLATLVEAGFLTREQRGKWAWYQVVPARLDQLREALGASHAPAGRPRR